MQPANAPLSSTYWLGKCLIHRVRNLSAFFPKVYFCANWLYANISTVAEGNQRPIVMWRNEPKIVTSNIYHVAQENCSLGLVQNKVISGVYRLFWHFSNYQLNLLLPSVTHHQRLLSLLPATFRTINRSKFDPNNSQSHCWQNYNFLLISSAGYRKKRKTRK